MDWLKNTPLLKKSGVFIAYCAAKYFKPKAT